MTKVSTEQVALKVFSLIQQDADEGTLHLDDVSTFAELQSQVDANEYVLMAMDQLGGSAVKEWPALNDVIARVNEMLYDGADAISAPEPVHVSVMIHFTVPASYTKEDMAEVLSSIWAQVEDPEHLEVTEPTMRVVTGEEW